MSPLLSGVIYLCICELGCSDDSWQAPNFTCFLNSGQGLNAGTMNFTYVVLEKNVKA